MVRLSIRTINQTRSYWGGKAQLKVAGFPPALLLSLQVLTRQLPPWSGMATLDLDAAGQVAQMQRSLVALARWEEPSPLAAGPPAGGPGPVYSCRWVQLRSLCGQACFQSGGCAQNNRSRMSVGASRAAAAQTLISPRQIMFPVSSFYGSLVGQGNGNLPHSCTGCGLQFRQV